MKNQTYDKAMPIKAVWPNSVTTIVQAAMIAALYVVLTILANASLSVRIDTEFFRIRKYASFQKNMFCICFR